jgi:DNA-binding GntR family transcriptional regulator
MASLDLPTVTDRTLGDQVAKQLREAIIHGQFAPGQHVVERDIAEAMQLSRGPVREALRILENEGLVIRYPHRGTYVVGMQVRDAEEIYSLREPLEIIAVDYVIKYATDEQISELDAIVDHMEAVTKTDYTQADATELDMQFHDAVYRISGHSRLQTMWSGLRGQVRMLVMGHRGLNPNDFREKGVVYHRKFAACLHQRDIQAAHQTVHEHLESSFSTVVEAIRQIEAGLDQTQSEKVVANTETPDWQSLTPTDTTVSR